MIEHMPSSYGRIIGRAVFIFVLAFAPYAHAETTAFGINDPITDTIQFWNTIVASINTLAHELATALIPQVQHPTTTTPHAPKNLNAPPVAVEPLPQSATSSENASTATSSDRTTQSPFVKSAVGNSALQFNTTGVNNTVLGDAVEFNNYSATNTVAVGYSADRGTSAFNNQGGTYLGYEAGWSAATGSDFNTFLGYQSGFGVTTGSNNLILASATSSTGVANLSTGSQNILIGNNVSLPSATASGQLDIGNIIYGTGITGTWF
jgi:hypothetical protein